MRKSYTVCLAIVTVVVIVIPVAGYFYLLPSIYNDLDAVYGTLKIEDVEIRPYTPPVIKNYTPPVMKKLVFKISISNPTNIPVSVTIDSIQDFLDGHRLGSFSYPIGEVIPPHENSTLISEFTVPSTEYHNLTVRGYITLYFPTSHPFTLAQRTYSVNLFYNVSSSSRASSSESIHTSLFSSTPITKLAAYFNVDFSFLVCDGRVRGGCGLLVP